MLPAKRKAETKKVDQSQKHKFESQMKRQKLISGKERGKARRSSSRLSKKELVVQSFQRWIVHHFKKTFNKKEI